MPLTQEEVDLILERLSLDKTGKIPTKIKTCLNALNYKLSYNAPKYMPMSKNYEMRYIYPIAGDMVPNSQTHSSMDDLRTEDGRITDALRRIREIGTEDPEPPEGENG